MNTSSSKTALHKSSAWQPQADGAGPAADKPAYRVLMLEADEAARHNLVSALQGEVMAGREVQLQFAPSPKVLMDALDADQGFGAVVLNAEYQSSLVGQALIEYIRDIHSMKRCSIILTAAAPFFSCNRGRIEGEFLSSYQVSDLRSACRGLDARARTDLLQASLEAGLTLHAS